jgi:integrase/recombinase XerD
MQISYGPRIDATKILSRRELALVITDLKAKAARTANARLNLILVRLACCCGLRVSEIAGLQMGDVRVEPSRPHLRIRRGASKGGRSRVVPLWWDAGTLRDLAEWKTARAGAAPDAPFVGSLRPNRRTQVLSRHTLRRRFKTACRVLGLERLRVLTIHHGRHTFISHALAGGKSLAEVRDSAGHANVSITSAYLHVAVEDEAVGELFRMATS